MVSLVARQGRQLQRYTSSGHRLVVGCIPYKFKADGAEEDAVAVVDQALRVLVISSQRGQETMFPKGGWEKDESMEEAASREAMEEAGVVGHIEVIRLSLSLYTCSVAGVVPSSNSQRRAGIACAGNTRQVVVREQVAGLAQGGDRVPPERDGGAAPVAGDGQPPAQMGDGGGSKGVLPAAVDAESPGQTGGQARQGVTSQTGDSHGSCCMLVAPCCTEKTRG